jgi:hypothetical protein
LPSRLDLRGLIGAATEIDVPLTSEGHQVHGPEAGLERDVVAIFERYRWSAMEGLEVPQGIYALFTMS